MKKSIIFMSAALLGTAFASVASTADFSEVEKNIRASNERFADMPVSVLREVEVPALKGFYEANVGGTNVIISKDGKIGILGDVFDFSKMRNLSAEYRDSKVAEKAASEVALLKDENFITYSPTKEKIGTAYVFTDTTCPYCQKLHEELGDYLNAGIEVKYVIYPRVQISDGAPAYEQSKQIMCASDKKKALDEIKAKTDNGKYVMATYPVDCVNTLNQGIMAGSRIGFSGTPYIYLSNGKSIGGYAPASYAVSLFE